MSQRRSIHLSLAALICAGLGLLPLAACSGNALTSLAGVPPSTSRGATMHAALCGKSLVYVGYTSAGAMRIMLA